MEIHSPVTANGSSSSAANALEVDLTAGGQLAPIPRALLDGRDHDLLAPLRFLPPGDLPTSAALRVDRRRLASALAAANASYGHPMAEPLATKLADPATRVVVTGQQPGLFGGPLLTLSKMAAAIRWAETLETAGQPAVAVFWVATEDHDWAEMTQARLLSAQGPVDLSLGEDPSPLTPVGTRTIGPGIEDLHRRLLEVFPGEFAASWLEPLARFYRPDARFGEAFCRLAVHLLGARAPLLLDATLPELKEAERPFLRRLVERRAELSAAEAVADERIAARGYALQVKPQPGTSPLFLLHGKERRRIEWRGEGHFGLRGLEGFEAPVEELLATLEENPAALSPGVLARPAIQDAVLGTCLQVMGPAEISYLPQVVPTYEVLGIEAPWTSLRPQVLVLEARQLAQIEELGVPLAALVEEGADLDRLLVGQLGEDLLAPVRREIGSLLEGLGGPIRALDLSLERPWQKTVEQIDRALDQLGAKTTAAVARRHEVGRQRLGRLHETCRPGGKLQERSLCLAHFLGRVGPSFGESFLDQLGLDPRRLHVIRM